MDGPGSRSVARRQVFLNAKIISVCGAQDARIRDLSPRGVHISCRNPPSADSDVIFERGPIFVAARVAWANETDAGLEFYRIVDPTGIAPNLQA